MKIVEDIPINNKEFYYVTADGGGMTSKLTGKSIPVNSENDNSENAGRPAAQ